MGGNSFGTLFKITTWGESHGEALGAMIDGCPPKLELSNEDIQKELDRRRPGQGEGSSPRKEGDRVEILSGIFEGKTTGAPISLLIRNEDVDSSPYEEWKEVFDPAKLILPIKPSMGSEIIGAAAEPQREKLLEG